jgi:VanZ family protein
MRDFSKPKLWLGIWIFGWLLCIALSMGPPPPIPSNLPEGDKIGHALAYGVLSAWAVMIFRTRRAWWRSAAALMALGVAIEFAQGALTTNRTADPYDALADALGILLGLGVALTPANEFLVKLERRWLS